MSKANPYSGGGNFVVNGRDCPELTTEFEAWLTAMSKKYDVNITSFHYNTYFHSGDGDPLVKKSEEETTKK